MALRHRERKSPRGRPDLPRLEVQLDEQGGIGLDHVLELSRVLGGDGGGGKAEGHAIAGEDLGEGLAHQGGDARPREGLGRVLPRGAAAEVAVDDEDRGPREAGIVEIFSSILLQWKARALESIQGLGLTQEKKMLEEFPALIVGPITQEGSK